MKRYKVIVLLLCLTLFAGILAGCGSHKKKEKSEESTSTSKDSGELDDITLEGMVSDALSSMTLKEKIGQMFIVCTDSNRIWSGMYRNGCPNLADSHLIYMALSIDMVRNGIIIFLAFLYIVTKTNAERIVFHRISGFFKIVIH